MKRMFLLAAILSSAAFLVSCGGGGGGEASTSVASEDLEVQVDATNGAQLFEALKGESVVYENGVPEFETTTATKVEIVDAAPDGKSLGFRISSDGYTATGTMEFGSCLFRITNTNYPSRLTVGTVARVRNCALRIGTRGLPADGTSKVVRLSLTLNGQPAVCNVRIRITADGTIVVRSVIFGVVRIRPVTGATGGF